MKKSLVALAALAATTAFAQSSVSITGYFDRGYTIVDNTDNTKDSKTIGSSAGTTAIKFTVVQDLGGGLKAGFMSETNPSDIGSIAQDTAPSSNVATSGNAGQGGAFNNGESFLNLTGGFGEVKLGSVNNELLTAATGVAAPGISTGVGSSYSSSWSIFNGVGTGATGFVGIARTTALSDTGTGVRGIRQANTIKYASPSINGFKFAYGAAGKNNNNPTAGGDTAGYTDMSLRYTNGPLDVMYASLKIDTNTNDTNNIQAVASGSTGATAVGKSYTHSLLGATYTMGAFKIHAGTGGTKSDEPTLIKTKGSMYGVSYTMGQWDFMAQTAKADDQGSSNKDRKMTGLGVNYNFSKTVRAYARYDSLNYNSNTTASGSEVKRTALGMSVTF
jgi:predicted porin